MYVIFIYLTLYLIPLIIYFLFEYICKSMGDCLLELKTDEIKDKTFKESSDNIVLSCKIPFENTGKQQAIVVDGVLRIQPEGSKYDKYVISSEVLNPELPSYSDNYWEAFLVKPKNTVWLDIKLNISLHSNEKISFNDLPSEIRLDLFYKYYGRSPLASTKREIILKPGDFKRKEDVAVKEEKISQKPLARERKPADNSFKTIPIKTHILRDSDDLMDIIKKYVLPESSPGDIIAIAESVVAILQGRAVYIEDIKPSYFATRINRFFKQDASLSSPYSLEMAFREAGFLRVMLAFVIGTAGKLIGRSGDFYRIAGRAAATIDDPPGTMPPFDKFVVLGPKEPGKVSQYIKAETGLDATVVDANDLGKVDVLGSTLGDNSIIVKALSHNPQGNADEQTPIVLIRPLK